MLGGDKEFNDKLSWALMVPLSAMAGCAAVLALMLVELALEGDNPGSLSAWMLPSKSFAMSYAGVLAGAKVAPTRKLEAASCLSLLYMAGALYSARTRLGAGAGMAWTFVGAAALGAAVACLRASRVPAEKGS